MPKLLVYKMLILHSSPVLPASLQCKLGNNSVEIAYFTQNWLVGSPPQGSRAFFFSTLAMTVKNLASFGSAAYKTR